MPRDFTHDLRLGGGMIGEVFEGYIDTNTSPMSVVDGVLKIAIRRYDHYKIDHCHLKEEFVDMTFLNKFNHPNLVKILGYCLEDEQLFLIYEFMENGSLYSHLITKDKMPLPWNTRVKIAVGIAEALLVLERTQKPVDIYPIMLHNILLDKGSFPNPSVPNL
ncbi:putative serine/threonine-protein kinase CST [Bidens hawaiensis]|uniref:putative serine/threonine-protein kinase CST n=1 Tax=Bidens hawaiensis TaxID=980011 RepID=UPI0040495D6E